jgi:predicted nucleic acid-binding protein
MAEYILFVDSNVFLDAFLQRTPNDSDCKALLNLAENRNIKIYTSSSCLLNVIYFLEKSGFDNPDIIQTIKALLTFISLISPDENNFHLALSAGFTDLEDAVQYYTALQIKGIDYFITSNIKDFKKSSAQLPVTTAKQFLKVYNKK